MAAALSDDKRARLEEAATDAFLTHLWLETPGFTGLHFDPNPTVSFVLYVDELEHAQRQGTLHVVNGILKARGVSR